MSEAGHHMGAQKATGVARDITLRNKSQSWCLRNISVGAIGRAEVGTGAFLTTMCITEFCKMCTSTARKSRGRNMIG